MEGDAQVEHDIKVDIFLGPNPPLIGYVRDNDKRIKAKFVCMCDVCFYFFTRLGSGITLFHFTLIYM